MAELEGTSGRRNFIDEHFGQRRLSLAVLPDKGHAFAALDMKIHPVKNKQIPIAFLKVFCIGHYLSRPRRRREPKVHHREVFVFHLYAIQLIELFLHRLSHFRFGCFRHEAVDRSFPICDDPLLVFESRFLLFSAILPVGYKFFIRNFVIKNITQFNLYRSFGYII